MADRKFPFGGRGEQDVQRQNGRPGTAKTSLKPRGTVPTSGLADAFDHGRAIGSASALNCDPLQTVNWDARNDGPFFMLEEIVVTSVTPGDPDAALFEIPANYVERSPGEVQAEYACRYNVSTAEQCDTTAGDAVYHISRAEPVPINTS